MNEMQRARMVITLVLFLAGIFTAGGIAGFFVGRGNIQRPTEFGNGDYAIERELEKCRGELELEREYTGRLESALGKARGDIASAIDAGGRAEGSIQSIIGKMERLVDCIRSIDGDLSNAMAFKVE